MQDDGFFDISQHSVHEFEDEITLIDSQQNSMDDDDDDDDV